VLVGTDAFEKGNNRRETKTRRACPGRRSLPSFHYIMLCSNPLGLVLPAVKKNAVREMNGPDKSPIAR
jgi:hypothetical protein